MSLTQKILTFVARCGAPAKFVAKMVIGYTVPGSSALIELVENIIDCAQRTAKDNLEQYGSKADLARVEKMFDSLLGDLKDVVEKLKHLEAVPETAKKTLRVALATEKHCLAAAQAIRAQGMQLSAVQADLAKLSAGQADLLDLQRRFFGSHLDYIEEQKQHNVSPSQLDERLKKIEEAIIASRYGDHDRAETISAELSQEEPESAVLAIAEAATQASGHNFVGAARSLTRASRLRPRDSVLAEMSRVATHLSRGATPVDTQPMTRKRPTPGATLDGWQLETLLGAGGWGQVFRARKGERVRALKIMHAELSQDTEFVKRFKREMATLMGLGSHPHLIQIDPEHLFSKADDWNCWYFVMEFVDGVTLETYLKNNGALTIGQAHVVFDGIAEGLKVAHQRGIIHRDIKPANILIRHKPEPGKGRGVLVDFGLAGQVDAHTRGAGYTAFFAAPEQMRQGDADYRSDVYSLAAAIYYCLLYNDVEKRGRFKANLLPADIPASVRTLLERCLDNDPGERPKDASAFVSDWLESKKGESERRQRAKEEAEAGRHRAETQVPVPRLEAVPTREEAEAEQRRVEASAIRERQKQEDVERERLERERKADPESRRESPELLKVAPAPYTGPSRMTCALLAIFLGCYGVHKFAMGKPGAGVTQIFLLCLCYAGLFIGWIEGIIYLTKTDEEFYQTYIVGGKNWF